MPEPRHAILVTLGTAFLVCGTKGRLGLVAFIAAVTYWIRIPKTKDLTPERPKRALLHDKYLRDKVPDQLDAIIIGSGMSGLTAAAFLARAGKKVVVLEQHDVAGGGTHQFDLKGFPFDSGLHYTVPWSTPLFEMTCNKKKVPQFTKMGDGTQCFDKIVLGNDPPFDIKHEEKHWSNLEKLFPDEQEALVEYLKLSNNCLASVKAFVFSKFFPRSFQPLFWKLVPQKWHPCKTTAKDVLSKLTSNNKLKALLCGLWIDTGGRPDEATMMLTSAVFRGLPLEGGCYPEGGSSVMAKALVPVIERHGGRVLVEADVEKITMNKELTAVSGVKMVNGDLLHAKIVISSTGYQNTYQNLVPQDVTEKFNIPRSLPGVKESYGFVMCNIGIEGQTCEELGVDKNQNIWYHPVTDDYDIFQPIADYFHDPMGNQVSAMLTFPSVKDKTFRAKHPKKVSCQILMLSEYAWFEKFKNEPAGNRSDEYQSLKKHWETQGLELLYRFFPRTKGYVKMVDVSTPLSISHYLRPTRGGGVGLDQTPKRYTDWKVQRHLDAETDIRGFFLTGQDTVICGVVLAQMSGWITACRILGQQHALKFILQSIFCMDNSA